MGWWFLRLTVKNFGHFTQTVYIIPLLDFHSTKRALWLVDSWSHTPDQIQMYRDRDTIVQLLPARRIQQHIFATWLLKGKSRYMKKHLMHGLPCVKYEELRRGRGCFRLIPPNLRHDKICITKSPSKGSVIFIRLSSQTVDWRSIFYNFLFIFRI